MADSWIETVIQNFFTNSTGIFGDRSTYQGFETNQNSIQTARDGIRSDQLHGRIKYNHDEDKIDRSISIFIKSLPHPPPYTFIVFSFSNEMNFYTKIAPMMDTLDQSFSSLFPKFYHGEMMFNQKKANAAIIFEDLKARGYKTAGKKSFLDYPHLALMMRKLGTFHAYSYKAKNTIPDTFYPMANISQETNSIIHKVNRDLILATAPRGLQLLQKPEYSRYVPHCRELVQNADDILTKILTGDRENPISVIIHGDYLRNNLMFRYKNKDIPDDLVIIDMDTYRYASPVIDLATVLYINADQATRDKYWDQLIDEYYTALKETFPDNEVPSKNAILSDFVGKSFYGYLVATYFLPVLHVIDNEIPLEQDFDPDIALKLKELRLHDIPRDIGPNIFALVGGEQENQVLTDILQDMIDRKFIAI